VVVRSCSPFRGASLGRRVCSVCPVRRFFGFLGFFGFFGLVDRRVCDRPAERVSIWRLCVGILTQYLVTQAVFGSRSFGLSGGRVTQVR
jgi:hypothetical protein